MTKVKPNYQRTLTGYGVTPSCFGNGVICNSYVCDGCGFREECEENYQGDMRQYKKINEGGKK